ncbi:MAG: ABC transporter permease [Bacilli bacterium]|jgi:ABC-2 type transport system permease protein|nr:ABC transporter permease [Bacilli bacterium]
MTRKFFYLVKLSFNKKLKSKWFIAVNIILALSLFALFNLNSIITFFGGEFDKPLKVLVYDKTNISYPYLKNNIDSLTSELEDKKIVVKSVSNENKKIKDDEILISLNLDDNLLKAKVISDKKIDSSVYQVIYQGLNVTKQQVLMERLNLDTNTLALLSTSIDIDRVVLSDKKSQDENMSLVMSTVFPSLILPFFMLIIFLVQMVGGEICEEKTTKSMEIIISNVSPKVHLLAKIIANNLFVLLQALLLFIYGLIAFFISSRNGSLNIPTEITSIWDSLSASGLINDIVSLLPFLLVLIILSFLAYSLLAGILASMTTNIEDFQQLQTPIVFILLAGYYLAIMAGMFQGSIFLKIAGYIPLISCLLAPTLYIMGEISILDILIAIILLIGLLYLLIRYGMKIYKVGILNYSNEKVWSKFIKAFRREE